MDYPLHVAVTCWDAATAVAMGAPTDFEKYHVDSCKFFMAYQGALMVNDAALLAGFRRCRALGALAALQGAGGAPVRRSGDASGGAAGGAAGGGAHAEL
jgi:dihydropyrimidinase